MSSTNSSSSSGHFSTSFEESSMAKGSGASATMSCWSMLSRGYLNWLWSRSRLSFLYGPDMIG